MMKKLHLAFALLFACLLTGCASAPAEPVKLDCFVFDENGYSCEAAPYGITPEELQESTGTAMEDRGCPPNTPFSYNSYYSTSAIELIGLSGKTDAQFTEEDGLFAFTFKARFLRDVAEKNYANISDCFIEVFGEPAKTSDNGMGLKVLEWQDKKSGTAMMISYSDLGTTDPLFQICVYEKWRYIEEGAEGWAEDQ